MNAIDLTTITGYRTNEDGTQTLAWQPREDGTVECVHEAPNCCVGCFEADERLFRNIEGDVIVGQWPDVAVRDGRTVTFVYKS